MIVCHSIRRASTSRSRPDSDGRPMTSFAASAACIAPDDAGQRREHAHRRTGHVVDLVGFREQAGIAGRARRFVRVVVAVATQVEARDLSIEADRRARDQRHASRHARAIDRVSRREVVRAVEDHVRAPRPARRDARRRRARAARARPTSGLSRCNAAAPDATFARPTSGVPCRICRCRLVRSTTSSSISREPTDAARGEVDRRGRAEAACADHQRMRVPQALLTFDARCRREGCDASSAAAVRRSSARRRAQGLPFAVEPSTRSDRAGVLGAIKKGRSSAALVEAFVRSALDRRRLRGRRDRRGGHRGGRCRDRRRLRPPRPRAARATRPPSSASSRPVTPFSRCNACCN